MLLDQDYHLTVERGVGETTACLNVRMVRPFLLDRAELKEGRLDLEHLTAGEIAAFGVTHCAIRSYLATARKHGVHFFPALTMLAERRPWLPSTA